MPCEGKAEDESRKNVIGSNETMTMWEEKKEWSDCLKRIFSFQYKIIQSHNTPKQHIMVLYASHIVPTYCHICNLWARVIFLQWQNWDTNIGAKGITCFILCWSPPPHTHLLLFIQPWILVGKSYCKHVSFLEIGILRDHIKRYEIKESTHLFQATNLK